MVVERIISGKHQLGLCQGGLKPWVVDWGGSQTPRLAKVFFRSGLI